jgi:NAD(P)-dependent dehydrogenase (short-subunit alcohol dehydrogenase family)
MPAGKMSTENVQVLIVTGASRGIGAATAQLAATRGFQVCVNYHRQQPAAEKVAAAIRQKGGPP